MSKAQYAIATTEIGLDTGYLFAIGVTQPLSLPFVTAVETFELGNGGVRVAGYGIAVWQWAFLEKAERDILRAFCSGYSSEIFIRTLDEDNEWANYSAIMLWPTKGEPWMNEHSMGLSITFKILEVLV